jgi:hypothetical protein
MKLNSKAKIERNAKGTVLRVHVKDLKNWISIYPAKKARS